MHSSKARNTTDSQVQAERGFARTHHGFNKDPPPAKETCCQRYRKEFLALFVGSVLLVCAGVGVAVVFRTTNPPQEYFGAGATNLELTMDEVARHNRQDDCWVVYYGEVYDMTEYAQRHPGGARIITKLAGRDGTEEYEKFHSKALLETVMGTKIGTLVDAKLSTAESSTVSVGNTGTVASNGGNTGMGNNPCPTGMTMARLVTRNELAQHATADDCWVVYDGNVYDMTQYARRHPGGARIITNLAGQDGTAAYRKFHSLSLLNSVKNTMVGPLEGSNANVNSECIDNSPIQFTPNNDSDSEDSED